MSNISYNPYQVAFSALVSPEAQQYYVRRSVEDSQALVGGVTAMVITIGFGLWLTGVALYTIERHIAMSHQSRQSHTAQQGFQPKNPVAMPQENIFVTDPVQKLLPPARAGFSHSRQHINEKFVLGAITPSCGAISLKESFERVDAIAQRLLPPATEDYSTLTVSQIRMLAKDRKIKNISRMTRAQLIEVLAA